LTHIGQPLVDRGELLLESPESRTRKSRARWSSIRPSFQFATWMPTKTPITTITKSMPIAVQFCVRMCSASRSRRVRRGGSSCVVFPLIAAAPWLR
jgi:hypothetical protein